jgi:tRNA(Ile)-lysidine synthase
VAFSGGLDSLVLLHLLRFEVPGAHGRLFAAHFDHRMRVGSDADARWVRGVCRAWDLPCHLGVADVGARNEVEARRGRYRFLEEVRTRMGGGVILTAHHQEDQAETVLFRMLRGTGPEGLEGIPEWRTPGIGRPLLPFSRAELEAYARRVGLRPRVDPSNQDLLLARNRIRWEILPLLEHVHPGAGRALVRLARLSRVRNDAVRWLLEPHGSTLGVEEEAGSEISLRRGPFLALPSSVRAELFRRCLDRLGIRISERGTAAALMFMEGGGGGKALRLPGAVEVSRSRGRIRIARIENGAALDSEAGSTHHDRPGRGTSKGSGGT